jgi:carbonic anhydrase
LSFSATKDAERYRPLATKYEGAQHCARIKILMDGLLPAIPDFDPSVTPQARLAQAVESNVRRTVQRIVNSPEGQARMAEGRMKIVGAVYEIETGRVRLLPMNERDN